jgi:hypothetical protein
MLMAITLDDEEGYPPPAVGANHVLDYMKAHGLPLTRETYLDLNGTPEPLDPELEAEIPRELREVPDDGEEVH